MLAVLPKENEKFIKKDKTIKSDELRDEYELSDFSAPLVRGKYVERLRESSNIVVLKPEVAAAFPNEEAVNYALLSLIKLAQTTTRPTNKNSKISIKN